MSVDPAEVVRLRRLADQMPDAGEFAQLDTLHEVVACMVALAIADGLDALNAIELVLVAAAPPRASLRASARVLRRLGYGPVADLTQRLARTSGRRRPKRRAAKRSASNPRERD